MSASSVVTVLVFLGLVCSACAEVTAVSLVKDLASSEFVTNACQYGLIGAAGLILILSMWMGFKIMDSDPFLFNGGKIGPLEQKIIKARDCNTCSTCN
mmetsp:Transcript_8718/g.13381  ORF Transcript_8718/g.13381 Transcript_8718/m.13381 type:complete len:98 (-) Transcript_8718:78-371(-)